MSLKPGQKDAQVCYASNSVTIKHETVLFAIRCVPCFRRTVAPDYDKTAKNHDPMTFIIMQLVF